MRFPSDVKMVLDFIVLILQISLYLACRVSSKRLCESNPAVVILNLQFQKDEATDKDIFIELQIVKSKTARCDISQ